MSENNGCTRYHAQARKYLLTKDPARTLARDAIKMEHEMKMFESKRAELFRLIGVLPDRNRSEEFALFADRMLSLPLPDSDKRLMERYIRNGELLHIIDTALATRLSERDADVMNAVIYGGLEDDELAVRYHAAERTIRRIRRKGMSAIRDEIRMRLLLVPELQNPTNGCPESE